jgi:hypothetical protein
VGELIQAIKFKCELVESNYLTVVKLVLQDFGEPVDEDNNNNSGHGGRPSTSGQPSAASTRLVDIDQFNTAGSEAIRPFMNDILEFIADMHVLTRLKASFFHSYIHFRKLL